MGVRLIIIMNIRCKYNIFIVKLRYSVQIDVVAKVQERKINFKIIIIKLFERQGLIYNPGSGFSQGGDNVI